MMDHESEILLDIEDESQVTPSQSRTHFTTSGIWRICGVLLTLALCATAAVCFTLNKSHSSQDDGSDLRHMLRAAPQQSYFTKDAIHLTGGDKLSGNSLKWKDNQDQAFVEGGLKLVNNQIIIPKDGIYFVYSQVSFYVTCKSNFDYPEDQEIVNLSHTVSRYSDSYEDYKPLFNGIRSACVQVPDSEKSLQYNTIYLGAAFRLSAGDKLRTETPPNEYAEVENNNGKTFFGAFAL